MKTRMTRLFRWFCAAAMCGSAFLVAAPAPAEASEPAAPEACFYYRVVWGDTLGRLAARYGTTVYAIMAANGLRSTVIYAGRTLCIPQASPTPSGGAWLAQFWNNTTQSGAPAYARYDSLLNFQWGFGTPNPGAVVADHFSGRWTRTYNFIGGVYRFVLNADDGIALWVDNAKVFDNLSYEGYQSNVIDVPIGPGLHVIRVDYVELTGLAKVSASFTRIATGYIPLPPPPPPPVGWTAEFFNNTSLSGSPVLVVATGPIDFNWGVGSIAPAVQTDNFSARFTSAPVFMSGVHRLYSQSDDGVKIWVDGVAVMNEWREQSLRGFYVDVPMTAGPHVVMVEYVELTGLAAVKVWWERR